MCEIDFIPMITMLAFGCGVRVAYVTTILKFIPEFQMISWAYPLTWALSSVVLLTILLRMDWTKAFVKNKMSKGTKGHAFHVYMKKHDLFKCL